MKLTVPDRASINSVIPILQRLAKTEPIQDPEIVTKPDPALTEIPAATGFRFIDNPPPEKGATRPHPRFASIAGDEAKILFSTSEPCNAYVEYGIKKPYRQRTRGELSFDYSMHSQPLKNLRPGQIYSYTITVENKDGTQITEDGVFETPMAVVAPPGKPTTGAVIADVSVPSGIVLPRGGFMYGAGDAGGIQTGNVSCGNYQAVTFYCYESGWYTGVRWEVRKLTKSQAAGRMKKAGPFQAAYKAIAGGKIDPERGGLMMGNGYSVGNPTLRSEIRLTTPDMKPDLVTPPLAIAREPLVYAQHANTKFPTQAFKERVWLEAGTTYCVHVDNLNPVVGRMYRVPLEEALRRPKDAGAMGFNGVHLGNYVGPPEMRLGPALRLASTANYFRQSKNAGWQFASQNTIGWIQLQREDGRWTGLIYTGYRNNSGSHTNYSIGGNIQARQHFTVRDIDREVTGVWLNFGLRGGSNGSPLEVRLMDDRNGMLTTGQIEFDDVCKEARAVIADSHPKDKYHWYNTKVWRYAKFEKAVTMKVGQERSLVLSAKAGAAYQFGSFFQKDHIETIERNKDGRAEVSLNGGKSWRHYHKTKKFELGRDLPHYFTLKGQPLSMNE